MKILKVRYKFKNTQSLNPKFGFSMINFSDFTDVNPKESSYYLLSF